MKYEDKIAWLCPVFSWKGDPKRCRACDRPLSGRQQRWCSPTCSKHYGRNHWWTEARKARLEMDDFTCQRCGVRSEPRLDQWEWLRRHSTPRACQGLRTAYGYVSVKKVWSGPRLEVNHVWPLAKQLRERKRYGRTTSEDWTEMVPLRHADSGCHHHLSLLVTLCKSCHRRTTNQQFGFRQSSPQLEMEVA